MEIFLLGPARCGTTLLRSVLGQHSRITMVNEPELLFAIKHSGFDARTRWPRSDRARMLAAIRDAKPRTRQYIDGLPVTCIDTYCTLPDDVATKDIYEALLSPGLSEHWGEKSLSTVFALDLADALYPRARFIWIVRDPRDSVASGLVKDQVDIQSRRFSHRLHARASARSRTDRWCRAVQAATDAAGGSLSSRWMTVRYEDFVANPVASTQRLCQWLGVEFEPSQLGASERAAGAARQRLGLHHRRLGEEITAASVAKPLPRWLTATIESEAAREMTRFDYVPRTSMATQHRERAVFWTTRAVAAALSKLGLDAAARKRPGD